MFPALFVRSINILTLCVTTDCSVIYSDLNPMPFAGKFSEIGMVMIALLVFIMYGVAEKNVGWRSR